MQNYLNKFTKEMSTTCLNPLEIWITFKCKTKKLLIKLGKSKAHNKHKQIHNTFLSVARNNLLKSKANLEYKSISLHALYKQLAPERMKNY